MSWPATRIRHTVCVTGKRAGSRRAAKPTRVDRSTVLGHALGITLLVVAWGYLVYLAIDFGGSARTGQPAGWWLLALASLGAVSCLFVGLLLIARLLKVFERPPSAEGANGAEGPEGVAPAAPRVPGGRRAAR